VYDGGCGGCALFVEVPEVIRCVVLFMLEAVEGALCLVEVSEVLEVIRCVLLCMLEVCGGRALLWRCRRDWRRRRCWRCRKCRR